MTKLLDWVETRASSNADFHIQCSETLLRESNTLLNIMLGGAGGGIALAFALHEKGVSAWQIAAIAAASIYFFVIVAVLTWKCLRVRPIYPPANEPQNLLHEDFDLDAIRRVELRNRQACIDANRLRNDEVGLWLNRCRLLAAATPMVITLVGGTAAVL